MTISIILIDDSEVIRFLLSKSLERDADLRIVASAADGIAGIAAVKKHRPDIVLLDIDMPQMDGLTALPLLRKESPHSKIIVVSGAGRENAFIALESLRRGAAEFALKPGADGSQKLSDFNEDLRLKIKALAASRTSTEATTTPRPSAPRPPVSGASPERNMAPITALHRQVAVEPSFAPTPEFTLRPETLVAIKAIAIASSTGGPEALYEVFQGLRDALMHVPIFITQHMPPVFTAALAEQLSRASGRLCIEGVDGAEAKPGVAYLAPGGYHMTIRLRGETPIIRLTQDPPVNSCRPSADPMFASLSNVYGAHLLAVVLTGIGNDGTQGAKTIADANGSVIVQDRESSVVYGMPKAAALAGAAQAIVPLPEIASYLKRRCRAAA